VVSPQAEHLKLPLRERYRGRKGKKATDGNLTKRLLIDNSRLLQKPIVIISTDTANCYDRMIHKFLASMSCLKWGVPATVIKSLLEPPQQARQFIRTAFGDSKTCFTGHNFQGAEQGNTGAAPY